MTLVEEKFNPQLCHRCGQTILTGIHNGLTWRVDLGLTPADAYTLDHYGRGVLVLENRTAGLWALDYEPGRPVVAGTYLAASHVCGSAHSQQLAKGDPCTRTN